MQILIQIKDKQTGDWWQQEDGFIDGPSRGTALEIARGRLTDTAGDWDIISLDDIRAITFDIEDGTCRDITEDVLKSAFDDWLSGSTADDEIPELFNAIKGNYVASTIAEAMTPAEWAAEHSTH